MTKIKKTLFVASSSLKIDEIKKEYKEYPFLQVKTLSQIVDEIFEFYDYEHIEINLFIGTKIIYKCLKNINYFSYLPENSETLELLYDYFIKLSTNEVSLDEFEYNEEKNRGLRNIFECYKKYKKENKLFDENDKLDFSLKLVDSYLKSFERVFVDTFEVGEINLLKNRKENQLLNKIINSPKTETLKTNHKTTPTTLYQNFAFNSYDEVRTAIKIAKKLIKAGESANEIAIVTSNFSTYAPYFYNLLDEYGLQGYDNIGFPLFTISKNENVLKNHPNILIQKAYARYFENLITLKNQLKLLKFTYDENKLKEKLLQETKFTMPKKGILFIEHNRLLGLKKGFKHTIFIGTDISNFPPKEQKNFLYSDEEAQKKFMKNDVYASSVTFYNELKRLSENLYIVTATYQNKRKLTPSIIIDKNIDNEFDIKDIQSRADILKSQKRIEEKELKDFQQSIINPNFTKFDGNIDGEFPESNKLSASALNTYTKCPMQYYFSNILKLQAPQDRQDGFDAAQRGTLMHECFEIFVKKAKKAKDFLNKEKTELYEIMFECSNEAYEEIKKEIKEENIYHKIELQLLQKGLDDVNSLNKGELAKFVDDFLEKEFEGFVNSNAEELFMLDENFKPIDLKDKNDDEIKKIDEEKRFIKGFIDRLDNLENKVNIIDYKSSLKSYSEKDFKKDILKNFQLGLYLLYATQQYPDKSYKASLISFKDNDKNPINLTEKEFNAEYINILKNKIKDISQNISEGNFEFNNEKCEWCNYKHICHQAVLEIKGEKSEEK